MKKILWILTLPVSLCALPSGGEVLSGSVEFVQSAQTLEIRADGAAVIQWESFDIAEGELVSFIQLDGESGIENRVEGNLTVCAGSCSSNAPLVLINDQGWDFLGVLQVSGGVIRLKGQQVRLRDGAVLDVSSENGGGVISIMQGIPLIEIEAGAQLLANGIDRAGGGAIYLYADDQLFFYGSASARGGDLRGNGGKITLTGWNALHTTEEGPQVDVSAPMGRAGIIRIYPAEEMR